MNTSALYVIWKESHNKPDPITFCRSQYENEVENSNTGGLMRGLFSNLAATESPRTSSIQGILSFLGIQGFSYGNDFLGAGNEDDNDDDDDDEDYLEDYDEDDDDEGEDEDTAVEFDDEDIDNELDGDFHPSSGTYISKHAHTGFSFDIDDEEDDGDVDDDDDDDEDEEDDGIAAEEMDDTHIHPIVDATNVLHPLEACNLFNDISEHIKAVIEIRENDAEVGSCVTTFDAATTSKIERNINRFSIDALDDDDLNGDYDPHAGSFVSKYATLTGQSCNSYSNNSHDNVLTDAVVVDDDEDMLDDEFDPTAGTFVSKYAVNTAGSRISQSKMDADDGERYLLDDEFDPVAGTFVSKYAFSTNRGNNKENNLDVDEDENTLEDEFDPIAGTFVSHYAVSATSNNTSRSSMSRESHQVISRTIS